MPLVLFVLALTTFCDMLVVLVLVVCVQYLALTVVLVLYWQEMWLSEVMSDFGRFKEREW
jgi:hypothetical protein